MYKGASEKLKETLRISQSIIANGKLSFYTKYNGVKIYGNSLQNEEASPDNIQPITNVIGDLTITNTTNDDKKSITVSLGDNFLAGINDLNDILSVEDDGATTIFKNIGYLLLDGDLDWQYSSSKVFYVEFGGYKRLKDTIIAMCDTYTPTISCLNDEDAYNKGNNTMCFYAGDDEAISRLYIRDDRFTTVEDFKANLVENNVTIYYQLDSTNEITLEKSGILTIYDGDNTFELTSNIETEYNVDYDKNIVVGGDRIVSSIEIEDDCYNSENDTILGSNIAKGLNVTIRNAEKYNFENRMFSLEIGVAIDEDESGFVYEYVPYGNFITTKVEDTKSNNEFKLEAEDFLCLFNGDFTDSNTYPITLGEFRHYVANLYGVEEVEQTLVNDDFNIEEKPYFDNMSGREVIKAIAQLNGCFVRVNRDNKLEYVLLKQNVTEDDIETIKAMKMNTKVDANSLYGEINVVVLSLGGDTTGENVTRRDASSIAKYGENIIEIVDNPFVNNQDRRTRAIDNLFNVLKGFKYIPTEFNYMGRIWLDAGDTIKVQDPTTKGDSIVYYDSIVLQHYLKIPELRQSSMENVALTKTQVENQYTSTEERIQSRTELMVDKTNERINSIVRNADGLQTQITQNASQITIAFDDISKKASQEDLNNLSSTVSKIDTTTASKLVTGSITADSSGITVYDTLGEVKTNIAPDGMRVINAKNNNELLVCNKDGVVAYNITVKTYFTAGYHRTEGYTENGKKRTGHFYVG